jgi:aminoglycoside phosphotransferase family enzyme/predicted kinase
MNGTWAQVRETHTGVVFFAGDRAFKAKKPVDFGFCNFIEPSARELACAREVELNARLAPDVYLGVGHLHLPDAPAPEPLVVMRRMPDDARLAARVQHGTAHEDDVRAIARLLAEFHDRYAPDARIASHASRDVLAGRWSANFEETIRFRGTVLSLPLVLELESEAHAYLAGREALFAERIAAGRIVDGHGDLLADDIFLLPDGPRILDCLEFDDALRHVDRIDDVAFLAMDLERLGAADLAAALLRWYREFSGDNAPESLVHHYIAYRALVRAKVACLRREQGDPAAASVARALSELALRHVNKASVRLVLIGGAPGTGKSTLATAIGEELGLPVLSSDRIRKELAGLDPETPAGAAYGTGLYDEAHSRRTYRELTGRAEQLLARGESVILDASWTRAGDRGLAVAAAARTHSHLIGLRCVAPAEVAAARMVGRRGPSDADAAIAAAMRDRTEEWPTALDIDTSGPAWCAAQKAIERIDPAHLPFPAAWRPTGQPAVIAH